MKRSPSLLLGLFALASCTGGGSRTPPSAALTPQDAGLDRPGDAATDAANEIYQSELPIYVSVDSIFHTVFAANDDILEAIEGRRDGDRRALRPTARD